MMLSVVHIQSSPCCRRVLADESRRTCKAASIGCQGDIMESALRKTAEVASKATPKPADRAPYKLADRRPPEPAEMATPKPAVGSSDEITSNPTAHMANPTAHMAATPAVASSAPSAPRRRNVRSRSGQGSRKGKDCDLVQHRGVHWCSHSNSARCQPSDWRFESADANRCSRRLRARSPDSTKPAPLRAAAPNPPSCCE